MNGFFALQLIDGCHLPRFLPDAQEKEHHPTMHYCPKLWRNDGPADPSAGATFMLELRYRPNQPPWLSGRSKRLLPGHQELIQDRTRSGPGTPPLWTTLPSTTTPGVDITP